MEKTKPTRALAMTGRDLAIFQFIWDWKNVTTAALARYFLLWVAGNIPLAKHLAREAHPVDCSNGATPVIHPLNCLDLVPNESPELVSTSSDGSLKTEAQPAVETPQGDTPWQS